MLTTPYNLESRTGNPLQFYDDLHDFTNQVLDTGMPLLKNYLDEYREFSLGKNEKTYQPEEQLMELLMIGIFWKNYHPYFSIDALFYQPAFNKLYQWRKKYKRLKPRIDKLRGKMAFKYLVRKRNTKIAIYERFEYLNSWLNDTQEFVQEVDRLTTWKLFIENQPVYYQTRFWSDVEQWSNWFILQAAIHLSTYTHGWDEFMTENYTSLKAREDFIFCTRKPSEYHLNMVAAEVMNRALRNDFEKQPIKFCCFPLAWSNRSNARQK